MKNKQLRSSFAIAMAGSLSAAMPAYAADQPSDGVESDPAVATGHSNILQDIIVTAARKRSEDVQKVPLAVTALPQRILTDNHVDRLTDLGTLAPNLIISRGFSKGDTVQVYMRGFGAQTNDPAVDPRVSIFMDGIYQPQNTGGLYDLFDAEGVEVLAGPQSTLLGKNVAIGALSISSGKPTGDFSGRVEALYGRYDRRSFKGLVNVPIVDGVLAARASFSLIEGGNWVYNTFYNRRTAGGDNRRTARLSLKFTPASGIQWDLTGMYALSKSPPTSQRNMDYLGGVPGTPSSPPQPAGSDCALYGPGGPLNGLAVSSFFANGCPVTKYGTTAAGNIEPSRMEQYQIASTIKLDTGPVTLTAVTGYINSKLHEYVDVDATPENGLDVFDDYNPFTQFSQEFRISSNHGNGLDMGGKLEWLVGGYYSRHKYYASNVFSLAAATREVLVASGLPPAVTDLYPPYVYNRINVKNEQTGLTKSYALFAHMIYHFSDKLQASLGVRQSWDDKEHSYRTGGSPTFFVDTPRDFKSTTVEAGVQYQITPDKMVYFRFAQGYQAGGFLGFPNGPGLGSTYLPQTADNFEIGAKTDWFDKRLRVNVALFLNKLKNLQVGAAIPVSNVGFIQAVANAGSAKVKGIEAQVVMVPTDNFTVRISGGYSNPKYERFTWVTCGSGAAFADCSRLPFSFAPKYTLNVGADYTIPLPGDFSIALSGNVDYRSSYFASDPPVPGSYQSGFALVNAGVTFYAPDRKYAIEVFGTNIFDKKYLGNFTAPGLLLAGQDGAPMMWNVKLSAKF